MRVAPTNRKQPREAGIALLISIFVLLLIGVVAIALIVSSGTESALTGNYRSSTNVYYAAVAGLEEVRGRLRPNGPTSFNVTSPGFLPPAGAPIPVCAPLYVINPAPGENVTPWDPANPYYDREFNPEFSTVPGCALPSPSPSTASIWNSPPLGGLPFPAPPYKWIRMNGVSEQSLNLDTGPNYDGIGPNLIYYNGNQLNDTLTGFQVLELTALAVLPNNSQKIVQYLVAPQTVTLPVFPAALTLLTGPGNNVTFSASADPATNVRGIDQDTVGACNPAGPIPAVGVFSNPDQNRVINGIPPAAGSRYTGSGATTPDVQVVGFDPSLQTPAGLQAFVQSITQSADVVINGSASGSNLPPTMSSSNPMTIVVNGDLDLTNWSQTGYGLLLVTGNFAYGADTSWRGIVLVIGQGTVTGSGAGEGRFDGVFLVANSNLGRVSMDYSAITNSEGIHYSSCWAKVSQPIVSFKILSFHEIAQ